MGEPLGLIHANDPSSRDFLRGNAGPPRGPTAEVRAFTGFERERATFARLKPDLLAGASGLFVVIVGDDFEGPHATFGEAEQAGYRRFGLGPLYIKQVLAEEPAQEFSRDIDSCRH